jgi:hydrogenase maturation factor HypE
MDIEGYAKRGLMRGDKSLKEKLAQRILEIKNIKSMLRKSQMQ